MPGLRIGSPLCTGTVGAITLLALACLALVIPANVMYTTLLQKRATMRCAQLHASEPCKRVQHASVVPRPTNHSASKDSVSVFVKPLWPYNGFHDTAQASPKGDVGLSNPVRHESPTLTSLPRSPGAEPAINRINVPGTVTGAVHAQAAPQGDVRHGVSSMLAAAAPTAEVSDAQPLVDVHIERSPRQWQQAFASADTAGARRLQYQSKGHVQAWHGDFMAPGAMEEMLQARAYKREIILTTADGGHLAEYFNLMLDFRDLRMEHTLVFMDSQASCEKAEQLMPGRGCTWAHFLAGDHPKPYWTRILHMWLMRWLLFNSIVRRGYNALILDTDNSVRMDPYMFLKSEYFRGFNQIVSFDEGIPEINCGAQYGQNIAPAGPVAWITAETVDRLLRWTENWSWFKQRLNVTPDLEGDTFFRVTFEQSVFRDATCSAMLQRPRFYHRCTDSLVMGARGRVTIRMGWRERHSKACRWWNSSAKFRLPDEWQTIARVRHDRIKYVDLKLPYSRGEYPVEWGHDPFPSSRGSYSSDFQEWLRRDVATMWPDVDSSADPEGLRGNVETMAQAPMWLFSRWIEIGERLGTWNLQPPMGVIMHTLVPGGRDNVLKSGIMKIYGWWHWSADQIINGGRLARHSEHDVTHPPSVRIISFAPSVELLFSKREHVHSALLDSLVHAALLSGRIPVFPLLPCDSPWLAHRTTGSRAARSLEATNMVDRFVVPFGPRQDLRCFWKAWACRKCHRVGMPWYEFEHILQGMPVQDRTPHEGNTILFEHIPSTRRKVDATLKWPADAVLARPAVDQLPVDVDHEELLTQLLDLSAQDVVWVGALFTVTPEIVAHNTTLERMKSDFDVAVSLCPEC